MRIFPGLLFLACITACVAVTPPQESAVRTEREVKLTLTEKGFGILRSQAENGAAATKTLNNVYFDDAGGSLRHKKIFLRVRVEDNKRALIGIKTPKVIGAKKAALFERQEHECELHSLSLAQALIEGSMGFGDLSPTACRPLGSSSQPIAVLIKTLGSSDLVNTLVGLGSYETQRTTFTKTIQGIDYTLDLDQIAFPGNHTAYELEVELQDKAGETMKPLMTYLQTTLPQEYKPSTRSKAELTFSLLAPSSSSALVP